MTVPPSYFPGRQPPYPASAVPTFVGGRQPLDPGRHAPALLPVARRTVIYEVPDPYTTDLARWAAELCRQDPRVPHPPAEKDWRRWAAEVVNFSGFAVLKPPQPVYYTRWQDWAVRLREAALAA